MKSPRGLGRAAAHRLLSWQWLTRSLGRQMALPFIITGIAAVGVISWTNYRLQVSSAEVQAKQQTASVVAETLALRAVYADTVVGKMTNDRVPVTPAAEFEDVPGAIPLPATLVHLVSDRINAQSLYRIDLISPWPVDPEKGPKPGWQQEAIQALISDPQSVQTRIETAGGESRLLYMTADFASAPSCVSCHNDPATGSPKTDFKLHDMMGALVVEVPLTEGFAAARIRSMWIAAGLALAHLALIGFVLWFQGRAIARPIARLAQAAANSSGQELTRSAERGREDELGVLARALSRMTRALQAAHERRVKERTATLTEANSRLQREVSERKQAEEALWQAKNDAVRASNAKSEFLSSMSHELRTPMNAILGFAQLLEVDPTEPLAPSQQENVDQILKAGEHLLDLINEVLDLARIETGRMSLSIEPVEEPVELGLLLTETLATVVPIADRRQISLQDTTHPHHDLGVLADRNRLRQILLNLLSNAIKYNRDAGTVTVAATVATDHLHLSVTDTGAGIPASQLADLFEPFNRLGAEATDVEGSGVGLTITKRLVELMDGTITVESVEGQGSSFTIVLPLVAVPQLDDLQPDEPPSTASTPPATNGSTIEDEPNPSEPAAAYRHTLLYVEDNPANQRLVQAILKQRPQVELLLAPQARMGLELARAHQPDLIIMDINLPGMSGLEALRWLQTYDETQAIPVIALSANAMPRDVENGLAAGFLRYLTKPIKVPTFLAALDSLLADEAAVESAAATTDRNQP